MNFVQCKGYMIPGLDFENGCSIWLLRWKQNPTKNKNLTEVWFFYPDGKRVCFIDPKDETVFFNKYHSFNDVIGSDITIVEEKNRIKINVNDKIFIDVKLGFSVLYSFINLILSEKNKVAGKTETGKVFENIPEKLIKIVDASVKYESNYFGKMSKTNRELFIGDSKASNKPIVSYCTLKLES
ncbi:MAG: hypothetical protein GX639_14450 [Fibrobacter sp.]|nr:hypothetical protein [Fibrobacter sp.]